MIRRICVIRVLLMRSLLRTSIADPAYMIENRYKTRDPGSLRIGFPQFHLRRSKNILSS